jgi:hypothetical protein
MAQTIVGRFGETPIPDQRPPQTLYNSASAVSALSIQPSAPNWIYPKMTHPRVGLFCSGCAWINRIVRNRMQRLFRLRLPGVQTVRGYSGESHAGLAAGSRLPRAFAVLPLASVTSRNDRRCGEQQRWAGHGSHRRPDRKSGEAPNDRVVARIYPAFPTSIEWPPGKRRRDRPHC